VEVDPEVVCIEIQCFDVAKIRRYDELSSLLSVNEHEPIHIQWLSSLHIYCVLTLGSLIILDDVILLTLHLLFI
jgi:hypothetical protein